MTIGTVPFAEIIVVQPEDSRVGSESQLVRAAAPARLSLMKKREARRPCTQVLSSPPSVVKGALAPLPCSTIGNADSVF